MKKNANENLKNKYLLIGLSVFCVLLIGLSFVNSDIVAPIKQVTGYLVTPVQKGINSSREPSSMSVRLPAMIH